MPWGAADGGERNALATYRDVEGVACVAATSMFVNGL